MYLIMAVLKLSYGIELWNINIEQSKAEETLEMSRNLVDKQNKRL